MPRSRSRLGIQKPEEADTRAGRFSSEDVHQALFKKRPTTLTLKKLRSGVRDAVRKRHSRA